MKTPVLMIVLSFILICGCEDPGPPGEKLVSVETTDDGWVATEKWELQQLSPGRWFDLSWECEYGAPVILVLTDEGRIKKFNVHSNDRIMSSSSVGSANLVSYEKIGQCHPRLILTRP